MIPVDPRYNSKRFETWNLCSLVLPSKTPHHHEMERRKRRKERCVPTMESFQGKERHGKQDQLYNNSQQRRDAFEQSYLTTCSPRDSTHSNTTITIEKAIQLMNTSPRDLMSMLQQYSSFPQPWKLRTEDMAVQEIIQERREVIKTGKLKGRRLFEPIQRERTILHDGLSGDMGQDSEVRSLSFEYSKDETYSSSWSSSLPCPSCDSVDKDQKVKEEETQDVCNAVAMVDADPRVSDGRPGNGGRYVVFLGLIAIALLMLAIYKSWAARRLKGHEVILVPT